MDVDPNYIKHAAGPVGAATALLWIKDTWPRKLVMMLGGAALSLYAAPDVAAWSGLQQGLAGFLLGLFGMAGVAKVFSTWEALDLGALLKKFIAKRLGVPE